MNSTDFAIRKAFENKTLFIMKQNSRFDDLFYGIYDDFGIIEVHDTLGESVKRLEKLGISIYNIEILE